MTRNIICKQLTELGYNSVVDDNDGDKALTLLQRLDIDLVITDWNMPNLTGLELMQNMKNGTKLATIPVLILTAECKRENITKTLDAGVNGLIVKPFTVSSLPRGLTKILNLNQH